MAERLRGLVPKARFSEAHGQMDETQLEETMLGFLRGDADCLVTTTIIESGLDIPSANTLIVERADQLGLAQAYQIRGRVGRSRERAFAYLLYPSAEALTEDAAARLSTLADHTELGSGFKIAMRDLDIRGAGDLLGDEQSGHVAAVGFELYCQMIDEAVGEAREAGEGGEEAPEPVRLDVPVDAYLPAAFIPFEAAKIDVHRRIAAAREPGELRAIRDEISDRFGPPPPEAENLLALQRARIELGLAGARSVEFRGGRLSVTGVELDSEAAGVLGEKLEGALYEWREKTVGGARARRAGGAAGRRAGDGGGDQGREAGASAAAGRADALSEHLIYAARSVASNQGQGRKSAGLQRLALLAFGALFVLLFVVFAIAQGIGDPSVPSGDVAVVEDAPDGLGPVTEAEFQHALDPGGGRRNRSNRSPNRATRNTKN